MSRRSRNEIKRMVCRHAVWWIRSRVATGEGELYELDDVEAQRYRDAAEELAEELSRRGWAGGRRR